MTGRGTVALCVKRIWLPSDFVVPPPSVHYAFISMHACTIASASARINACVCCLMRGQGILCKSCITSHVCIRLKRVTQRIKSRSAFPLESANEVLPVFYSSLQGCTLLCNDHQTRARMLGTHQSSCYPINAPHFWVYCRRRAFPPQFTPLSDSDLIPLASCSVAKLEFMTVQWGSSKQPRVQN